MVLALVDDLMFRSKIKSTATQVGASVTFVGSRDAALTAIPTVGYVSHVDVTTIDAARAAGVGEVLARSAFVARLAELVAHPPPRGGQGGGRAE